MGEIYFNEFRKEDDAQPSLFDLPAEQTAFEKYHAENPQIYRVFKRFAIEAINAGCKHLGAQTIVERVRWETNVMGNDGYKINNNYSAYYSRLFMKEFPQHVGFFATRTAKADKEI